jgi:anti-anti-sigma factor
MTAVLTVNTIALPSSPETLIRCEGEIDCSNVHLLRTPLHAYQEEAGRSLTVDLLAVQYLDTSAIGALLAMARRLFAVGERLRLRTTPRQAQLFHHLGCQQVFELLPADA